jgi:hypothetical protein
MTNGLRNHPGNRKGLLRDYFIGMAVVIVLAIVASEALRYWLY